MFCIKRYHIYMHKITTKKKRMNDEGRYLKGTGSTDVCHVLVAV